MTIASPADPPGPPERSARGPPLNSLRDVRSAVSYGSGGDDGAVGDGGDGGAVGDGIVIHAFSLGGPMKGHLQCLGSAVWETVGGGGGGNELKWGAMSWSWHHCTHARSALRPAYPSYDEAREGTRVATTSHVCPKLYGAGSCPNRHQKAHDHRAPKGCDHKKRMQQLVDGTHSV